MFFPDTPGILMMVGKILHITAAPQKVDTEWWKNDGKCLPLQADEVVRPEERA